jgi:hypothetical protein
MTPKQILKIVLIVLLVAGIGWGAYYLFQNREVAQELITAVFPGTEKTEEAPTAGEPEIPEQKLNILLGEPIFDYWINKKSGQIYLVNESGQIGRITGQETELANSQTLSGLNKVLASFDGSFAFAKFNYPSLPTFSIFNTSNSSWQPINANVIAAAWSPNTSEIAYLDDKSLNIFNLATQRTRRVLDMTQKDAELQWISTSTILISQTPSVSVPATMWALNLSNNTLRPIFKDEAGLLVKWSTDSELGIKLHSEKRLPVLSLVNQSGQTFTTFNFATLPSKCLIQTNKVYCAVPKSVSEGVVLPDDYFKNAVYFDDILYAIDLSGATGVTELQLDQPITIDAEHLELLNGQLLFKNRLDGRLYGLKI